MPYLWNATVEEQTSKIVEKKANLKIQENYVS